MRDTTTTPRPADVTRTLPANAIRVVSLHFTIDGPRHRENPRFSYTNPAGRETWQVQAARRSA